MSDKAVRSPASEFPNDNTALHCGAVWVVGSDPDRDPEQGHDPDGDNDLERTHRDAIAASS
jgi:hypothetical protein